jgi:Holliday junction resolvasome RuvABC DNA-binding subunit
MNEHLSDFSPCPHDIDEVSTAPKVSRPTAQRIVEQLVQKMREAFLARQPVAGSSFETEVLDASDQEVSQAVWALQSCGYGASSSALENGHHLVSMHC